MSEVRKLVVEAEEGELRLDRWFRRRFPGLGHAVLERLLRTGQVRVDGRRAKSGTRLAPGQVVRVPPLPEPAAAPPRPAAPPSEAEAAALRAAVVFRDEWLIALDKPPGLAVQGGTGQRRHLDAMLAALRFGSAEAPRLVHRLDRDTSGVLLLARSAQAARRLTGAFKGKGAHKVYWALVVGVPRPRRGRIDLPLAKRPGRAGEKVGPAGPEGKPALTHYRVVAERALGPARARLAWLVLVPLTGRTHQLRSHCAVLGTPILGDGKYGGKAAFPEGLPAGLRPTRLMLHAREIALPHPEDGTTLRVSAPLADDMAAAWSALGFDPGAAEAEAAADDLRAEASAGPARAAKREPRRRPATGRRRGPRSGRRRAR